MFIQLFIIVLTVNIFTATGHEQTDEGGYVELQEKPKPDDLEELESIITSKEIPLGYKEIHDKLRQMLRDFENKEEEPGIIENIDSIITRREIPLGYKEIHDELRQMLTNFENKKEKPDDLEVLDSIITRREIPLGYKEIHDKLRQMLRDFENKEEEPDSIEEVDSIITRREIPIGYETTYGELSQMLTESATSHANHTITSQQETIQSHNTSFLQNKTNDIGSKQDIEHYEEMVPSQSSNSFQILSHIEPTEKIITYKLDNKNGVSRQKQKSTKSLTLSSESLETKEIHNNTKELTIKRRTNGLFESIKIFTDDLRQINCDPNSEMINNLTWFVEKINSKNADLEVLMKTIRLYKFARYKKFPESLSEVYHKHSECCSEIVNGVTAAIGLFVDYDYTQKTNIFCNFINLKKGLKMKLNYLTSQVKIPTADKNSLTCTVKTFKSRILKEYLAIVLGKQLYMNDVYDICRTFTASCIHYIHPEKNTTERWTWDEIYAILKDVAKVHKKPILSGRNNRPKRV